MTEPVDHLSPIFIGGQRRSGTSLFRVLLNRHPNIACGPEAKLFDDGRLATWHGRLAQEWEERIRRYGFDPEILDRCMAALVSHPFSHYARHGGKVRWAEKSPGNIAHIDYLFRLFPDAQFVHVIRDPRDTYCSIRERSARDKGEWQKFHPSRAARDWRNAVLAGERWRTCPERYLEIHYEALVGDTEGTLREVLSFLHEPWDARMLDLDADNAEAQRDRQVRREPITAQSVGRWRTELTASEVKKIERVAGDLMRLLGYDTVSAPRNPSTSSTLEA